MVLAVKLLLILVSFGLWHWTQKKIAEKMLSLASDKDAEPIADRVHDWTEPFYLQIKQRPWLARLLLISSSLIVDVLGIFLIVQTLWGEGISIFVGLLILFALRQVNQYLVSLPVPKNMIWHDPGVPSLFVTYGVSNDLFFSGHTALAVYAALILGSFGGLWAVLAAIIVIYEIVVVLLLRAHWTLDVYAGAVTAVLVYTFIKQYAANIDQFFLMLVS